MFYSMVNKCMTQWQMYFGNRQVMWKNALFLSTLPIRQDNFTFFSVLMIEYLVATSYELWMIKYMLYVAALMTIAAEIGVEKNSICVR